MDTPDMQKGPLNDIDSPEIVDRDVLQALEYGYRNQRDITIEIEQPEFTSRCPMSGLPDFGSITIRYIPDQEIVELKSLKYYLLQYRNVGIFYEHVVNRILEDFVDRVRPKWLEIVGTFTPRGGIMTTARVQFKKE